MSLARRAFCRRAQSHLCIVTVPDLDLPGDPRRHLISDIRAEFPHPHPFRFRKSFGHELAQFTKFLESDVLDLGFLFHTVYQMQCKRLFDRNQLA